MKEISLKKNYIYNLAYQLLAIVVPLITTPYVSRILRPDGIGTYSYALSVVTYFSLFGALGVATYGQLQISKNREDRFQTSKLFWEIFIAKCISMGISLLLYIYFINYTVENKTVFIILLVNILGALFDISWFFQGLELFKLTVTRNFFIKIISTILIFTLVKTEKDLFKYIFIVEGAVFLGNLSLFPYLKKYIIYVNIKELHPFIHWRSCFVYFIPTIATSIYTIFDKSMLGYFSTSKSENGFYEQAHKIEQILVMLVTSLGTVTMPRISYLAKHNNYFEIKKLFEKTLTFILMISIPMCLGVISLSDVLIPWFLGQGYEKCIILLNIFSILIIIIGLDFTIGKQCLVALEKQNKYNISVIMGAIVNFMLNLILIPIFYSIGAAVASVFAELTILSLFIYFSRDLLDIKSIFLKFIKYSTLSSIMYIIIIFLKRYMDIGFISLGILSFVGILIYGSLLIIIKDKFVLEIFNKYCKRQIKSGLKDK